MQQKRYWLFLFVAVFFNTGAGASDLKDVSFSYELKFGQEYELLATNANFSTGAATFQLTFIKAHLSLFERGIKRAKEHRKTLMIPKWGAMPAKQFGELLFGQLDLELPRFIPTQDGRINPELAAPSFQVHVAAFSQQDFDVLKEVLAGQSAEVKSAVIVTNEKLQEAIASKPDRKKLLVIIPSLGFICKDFIQQFGLIATMSVLGLSDLEDRTSIESKERYKRLVIKKSSPLKDHMKVVLENHVDINGDYIIDFYDWVKVLKEAFDFSDKDALEIVKKDDSIPISVRYCVIAHESDNEIITCESLDQNKEDAVFRDCLTGKELKEPTALGELAYEKKYIEALQKNPSTADSVLSFEINLDRVRLKKMYDALDGQLSSYAKLLEDSRDIFSRRRGEPAFAAFFDGIKKKLNDSYTKLLATF